MSNNNNTNDFNEREGRVLELCDQGKNTREIAKELRMSIRDIGFILKKGQVNHGIAATIMDNGNNSSNSNNNNNKPANEKAPQAYKLFSEGKKPVEVAIRLGLREKQVNNLFREFWKLNRLNKLYEIYPKIDHCLPSFLKLHSALKKRGLNPDNVEWFADAIETGAVELPESDVLPVWFVCCTLECL
jgi:DNA-binding CsgD family transcriptional regulator